MPKPITRSPQERRASVERIVAASNGRAPRGVRMVRFRRASADEIADAEEFRDRARAALARIDARKASASESIFYLI